MRSDDQLADLWDYLDKYRGREPSVTLVDRWMQERIDAPQGQSITPDLLYALSERRGMWQDGQFLTPQPLATFIARLAALYSATSILDPTCGSGLLLHAVAARLGAEAVHGIDINPRFARLAQAVLGDRATIVQSDALSPQPGILDHYDLIVADPPFGMRLDGRQHLPALGDAFNGDFGHALTVWACERLTDDGAALVIVTPAFLWGPHAERIHQAIAGLNCRIRALIHLPGGSLHRTGIDSYLVVLERGEQKDVFVGQYDEDVQHQEQLVANIKRCKPGPQPALGRLCPLTSFKGFESFAASERMRRLAKAAGWTGLPATQVFTAHCALGQRQAKPIMHGSTSCYLRVAGRPLAVLDPEELPGRGPGFHRQVLHLHLAPERADPRFMVHWFNTSQIGKASLASVTRESSVPRIDLSALMNSVLYLPPLAEQLQAVEGAGDLTRIRAVADELEAALWDGTGDIAAIVHDIATINQEDRFEDWIETLPFPLASILWRHHAGGRPSRERYEVLLHFFEATAAFLATVHLSAFMSSEDLWQQHGGRLSSKLEAQHLSVERATFGTWKLVNEYLSSACGKLVQDRDKAELWQRIYATPSERVLTMLSSSDLRTVLQRANRIRNDWSGHTGAIGNDKARQIERELMELVHSLRGMFGRTWLGYELVQAGSGRYSGGIHLYEAKRLMGTRSAPFQEVQIESLHPLENEGLYLFDTMSRTGLHLQPFVRVMPSPEKQANACFFLNRREDDRFRFVSYHFEAESEIADAFPDVEEALGRLHRFDGEPTS